MIKRIVNSIALVFLIVACEHDEKAIPEEGVIRFESNNLLHPLFFDESNLFNISFPSWFDKSELMNHKIDSIYLGVLVYNWLNDTSFTQEKDYSFQYSFDTKGNLKRCVFTDNYQLTTLFEASFDYTKSSPDSVGYCLPRIVKAANALIGSNPTKMLRTLSDLQRFDRFELISSDESLIFKNTTSTHQEHHIFISNPENQNILFVDKLETAPEDVFYYGTPNHYTKAFSLTGLVKEDLRNQLVFFEDTNYPLSKQSQSNGLVSKTQFNYSEKGRWVGQQDSLALNTGQFIKLTKCEIIYNKQGLPLQIDFKTGSKKEDLRLFKTIKLNYAIREK